MSASMALRRVGVTNKLTSCLKKEMPPQRKAGATFFERRFLFSKDYWISFQKDFWIILGFSTDGGFGFSFGLWTFGSFYTGIRFGFSDIGPDSYREILQSDFWTWFFWIFGLGFSLDRWI
jgi:hypothetical protein